MVAKKMLTLLIEYHSLILKPALEHGRASAKELISS
jgi:hypothetical protein